jgi:P4 family phage/plasmid primase-like protien
MDETKAYTETPTDAQIANMPKLQLRLACRLARQGFHFAPARIGETHGEIGWSMDATADLDKIKGWLAHGSQLVMVAKFGQCAALDVDDWDACKAEGFNPEWLDGMFRVGTPSGGFHIYLPWQGAFDFWKAAKADAYSSDGRLIAELKLNNSTIAAPGSFRRASEDGKKCEGYYLPPTPDTGAGAVKCEHASEIADWFKAHGKAKRVTAYTGNSEPWKFHPDFQTADFLEYNECCLADGDTAGMFSLDGGDAYGLVLAECPLCGVKARPNSTQTNFLTKFLFSGNGYGFKCCKCGVDTCQEFEAGMPHHHPDWTPWTEPIYRHDDDELLLADGEKAGFGVTDIQDAVPSEKEGVDILQGEIVSQEEWDATTKRPESLDVETINTPPMGNELTPVASVPVAPPPAVTLSTDCGEMEVGDWDENITCTDLANGKRLAHWCGNNLCYVVERKCWYVWDGRKWAEDVGNVEVNRLAKDVAKAIFMEADNYEEETAKAVRKWAWMSCGKSRIDNMREMAVSEGTIAKRAILFDQDSCLFNCQNGVINLRTGELLPHKRDYWMMNISPVNYNPTAQCPVWLAHLDKIQRGDAEMIGFLQRLAGYSMVGSSEEETATFLWGDGRNGKGKTLEILRRILGDYATTVPFATFLEGARYSAGGATPEIASLAGKRMVVAQESNVTGRFNEALLKTLTGRDRQKARHLYQESIEFTPVFTLWLASNSKPRIIDQSEAMKRRIKLVPFTVQIPEGEVDTRLPEKLWAEREGILAWCVRGAVEWYKTGLCYPVKVKEASRDYFADEDSLGQWLKECTEDGRNFESGSGLAYNCFTAFAKENNYFVLDAREFKYRLEQKGYERKRTKTGVVWQGFKLTRLGSLSEEEPKIPVEALG